MLMLNSEQNVPECDATDDDSSNEVDLINLILHLLLLKERSGASTKN